MIITTFNEWVSFNESKKESRLNFILDKMSNGEKLTNVEQSFLDNYEGVKESDLMDSTLLNLSDVYDKITNLLQRPKIVQYNLENVIDIKYCEDEMCVLTETGKIKLPSNCLYNLIHNVDNDHFTLEIHGEYYEKIPLNND